MLSSPVCERSTRLLRSDSLPRHGLRTPHPQSREGLMVVLRITGFWITGERNEGRCLTPVLGSTFAS